MRSITLGDVATHARVSRGTVSNVLNHPERVSPPLLERVRTAMDELGFVRNESARQLRSGSSNQLALSLLDTWNPYFNDVTRGIEDVAYAHGLSLSVSTSALDGARESRNLEMFQQWRVRGILAVPTSESTIDRLMRIRRLGLSAVLVDRRSPTDAVPSVGVDDVEGGRLAGEHLRSLGRCRIMYAGNPEVHTHAQERLRGLADGAGREAGIELFTTESVTLASGAAVGREIAARPPRMRPDALFCANDLVAIGAMQVLLRERIPIPEEIAVVGYDDIEFASQVTVPLTTIRQPAYDLGRQAAELLLADIAAGVPEKAEHVSHVPALIVRESTVAD